MNTNYFFLGDSITDANHLWLPETNGLGDGYVAMLANRLGADAMITNKGIDGFTVAALSPDRDQRHWRCPTYRQHTGRAALC